MEEDDLQKMEVESTENRKPDERIRIERGKSQNTVVIAGRWICYKNNTWDFKLDKSRMGRIIDFAEIEDYTRMQELLLEEYNLPRDVFVEMTYWLQFGEGTKPMSISNDDEVGVFRSLQNAKKCVNVFATFRERVGGKLLFLGETSKLIEQNSDHIVSVQVGDGAGITNNDSSNVDDELRFSHVEARKAEYGGNMLKENHEQTFEKDPGRTDDEQSDEDQAYDFWTDLINKEHGENIGGEESDSDDFVDSLVVNKLNNKVGSDGLDKEAVKKRSNESLALKKCTRDISVDEIYGFDDVELMFNSLED